ncbi:MAG: glycerol-3-phosphate acyltransferase [Haloplasmataceae bacterium]|jgi:glycerol-3-phosphate acyltransferase PlsY|nr:glycerol-3-phosphate acyltransferase [Haloplasmataceae bacterium]
MAVNIFYLIICYLIGSIPSGLIIGKSFKNIDIREFGSGNLGGTNAIRVLGKKLGGLVAIMDVLKGGICVLLANKVFNTNDIPAIFFGLMAVIGHVIPIFAGFRGGKAVATSGGVLLFSSWPIFLIGIITFIITLKITKYVSVSSTFVAFVIFITTLIAYFNPNLFFKYFNVDEFMVITIFILMMFIILRHIPNYKRLLKGNERKIGQKK